MTNTINNDNDHIHRVIDLVRKEATSQNQALDVGASPTTIDLGREFVKMVVKECYAVDVSDFTLCDGPSDGGIDCYWEEAGGIDDGKKICIIQGKFTETKTDLNGDIYSDLKKLGDTIKKDDSEVGGPVKQEILFLKNQIYNSTENDTIIYIYATVHGLNDLEIDTLEENQKIIEEAIHTINAKCGLEITHVDSSDILRKQKPISCEINCNLIISGDQLLYSGLVSIYDIYEFCERYKKKSSGKLSRLFDANIRSHLGRKNYVNRKIMETLDNQLEKFGHYNNGVTFVVEEINSGGEISSQNSSKCYQLMNPSIVNGCQTINSIWDTFNSKIGPIAQKSRADNNLINDLQQYSMPIKIVINANSEDMKNITKFTNTQTAIKPEDFFALNDNFKIWHEELLNQFGVYFEIGPGGWFEFDKEQNNKNKSEQIDKSRMSKAMDLLRVYGAAWLESPGNARRGKSDFYENGLKFDEMMNPKHPKRGNHQFGTIDLYASFVLKHYVESMIKNYVKENSRITGQVKHLACFIVSYFVKTLTTFFAGNINDTNDINDDTLSTLIIYMLDDSLNKEYFNNRQQNTPPGLPSQFFQEKIAQEISKKLHKILLLYFAGHPNQTDARWLSEDDVASRGVSRDTYMKHSSFGKKGYSKKLHEMLEEQSLDLLMEIKDIINDADNADINLSMWGKNSIDTMDLTDNFHIWFESL